MSTKKHSTYSNIKQYLDDHHHEFMELLRRHNLEGFLNINKISGVTVLVPDSTLLKEIIAKVDSKDTAAEGVKLLGFLMLTDYYPDVSSFPKEVMTKNFHKTETKVVKDAIQIADLTCVPDKGFVFNPNTIFGTQRQQKYCVWIAKGKLNPAKYTTISSGMQYTRPTPDIKEGKSERDIFHELVDKKCMGDDQFVAFLAAAMQKLEGKEKDMLFYLGTGHPVTDTYFLLKSPLFPEFQSIADEVTPEGGLAEVRNFYSRSDAGFDRIREGLVEARKKICDLSGAVDDSNSSMLVEEICKLYDTLVQENKLYEIEDFFPAEIHQCLKEHPKLLLALHERMIFDRILTKRLEGETDKLKVIQGYYKTLTKEIDFSGENLVVLNDMVLNLYGATEFVNVLCEDAFMSFAGVLVDEYVRHGGDE